MQHLFLIQLDRSTYFKFHSTFCVVPVNRCRQNINPPGSARPYGAGRLPLVLPNLSSTYNQKQ